MIFETGASLFEMLFLLEKGKETGFDYLSNWSFDFTSSIITILSLAIIVPIVNLLRKNIRNWSLFLFEGLLYKVGKVVKLEIIKKLSLNQYCTLGLSNDESKYLHVPSSLDIKLEVDKVFISLALELQTDKSNSFSHSNIFTVGNRIRVIGDPGSGKSSLVKKLFRDACNNAKSSDPNKKLPIFFELKKLKIPDSTAEGNLGNWFFDKLRSVVANYEAYEISECFEAMSKGTGLLVLLDGLDEVSSNHYPRVEKAIKELSQVLSNRSDKNIIILTMREQFHFYVKDSFRYDFGQALFIKPFSPSDIYEFLSRWPFANNIKSTITRIYEDLTDHPTLRELCSNPLILSMYVAEDQSSGHFVAPDSRTEFYKKVTEELIIRRRLQQIGPVNTRSQLRAKRQTILGRLAFEHLLDPDQPANLLSFSRAIKVIQAVKKCTKEEASSHFRELSKETGLISEEQPGETFRFLHLTICEYFAALEAVEGQRNGWQKLIETHHEFQTNTKPYLVSRLIEVIPFACGLLPRLKRYAAISDVKNLGNPGILIRSFLETKLYEHDCWPNFIENYKQQILNVPEAEWDDKWLRNLHLLNVVIRDSNQCNSAEINFHFIQQLVNQQKDSLSKLLNTYATQDAAAVFRLAEFSKFDLVNDFPELIISNCDQPPFLALVIEKTLSDLQNIGLWATLLSEAALRSRVVVQQLVETKPSPLLEQFVSLIPNHNKLQLGDLPKSFYRQIITIAGNPSEVQLPFLKFVNIVRSKPFYNITLLPSLTKYILLFIYLISINLPIGKPTNNSSFRYIFTFILYGFTFIFALVIAHDIRNKYKQDLIRIVFLHESNLTSKRINENTNNLSLSLQLGALLLYADSKSFLAEYISKTKLILSQRNS